MVLSRLSDVPGEQTLSPQEMRRVRAVVRVGVRRLWWIATLNLLCAALLLVFGELYQQLLSRELAAALGAFLAIGFFYFLHVPGWLAELREFRWKVAERESLRKRKQEALRELGGNYEPDTRFDKRTGAI